MDFDRIMIQLSIAIYPCIQFPALCLRLSTGDCLKEVYRKTPFCSEFISENLTGLFRFIVYDKDNKTATGGLCET